MPTASDNELRWLLGKITHCASNASSLSEFEVWMEDVSIPEEIVEVIKDDTGEDRVHEAAHAAFIAACWLHGHGSEREAVAHARINAAFSRLLEMPETAEAADGDAEPDRAEGMSPAEIAVEGADLNATEAVQVGEQHVSVARDVNAPIVNAPGGNVYINDSAGRIDRLLHDYLTFLVYVALGVKLPHATDGVREKVQTAMDSLVDYHGTTRRGGIGNTPELRREAPQIWDKVDAACRAIFGLSFEESRPGLFEAEFPSWPLFENMMLIRGGSDPYTGARVEPFYLARFPVTVSQYAEFCRTTGYHPVPEWPTMAPPEHLANHPVTGVTLFDTVMFCVWLEAATGFRFRVATESEWCFAATAGARRQYPWGDDYREGYANTTIEGGTGTQPVDGRPQGASVSGVEDLVGNVWELTSTLFEEEPQKADMNFTFPPLMFALSRQEWWETDKRIPQGAGPWIEAARFVMRGGSWGGGPEWATMDQRIWTSAFNRGAYGGFRIACSAEPVGEGFVPTPSYLSPRLGGFADRIQLVKADGSAALMEKDFTACGGGSTFEGAIREQLLNFAVGRYETVGGEPIRDLELLENGPAQVANVSRFPDFKPRRAGNSHGTLPPVTSARSTLRLLSDVEMGLEIAEREARALGHESVGDCHLLLGLIEADNLTIGCVLMSFGLSADRIRDALANSSLSRSEAGGGMGPVKGAEEILGLEGDHGLVVTMDVFWRLMRKPDHELRSLLREAGIDSDALEPVIEDIRLGSGLLRRRDQKINGGRIERALATYRNVARHSQSLAAGPLAALSTAHATAITEAGADAEEVKLAEAEAQRQRQAIRAGDQPIQAGLSRLLHSRFELMMKAERYEDAAAALKEAIAIDESGRTEGDRLALAWALINRSIALGKLGQDRPALESVDAAIPVLRRLARESEQRLLTPSSAPFLLALAHSNKAYDLMKLGDGRTAMETIVEALRVILPILERVQRPAAPGFHVEGFEENYRDCCQSQGVDPDQGILARLSEAHEEGPDLLDPNYALSDVAHAEPVPFELFEVAHETTPLCSFCGERRKMVGGLLGYICVECLSLAGRVFAERDRDASPRSGDSAILWRNTTPCNLCGWLTPRDDVVAGGHTYCCQSCHNRAESLVST